MADDINNKPLTIKDIREVLIPAMQEVFTTKKDLEKFATKVDLQAFEQRAMETFSTKVDLQTFEQRVMETFATKGELLKFKDSILSNQDKMLKDLDILITEKTVSNYQKEKERKLWTIMIEAMKEHKILSPTRVKEIDELEVF